MCDKYEAYLIEQYLLKNKPSVIAKDDEEISHFAQYKKGIS